MAEQHRPEEKRQPEQIVKNEQNEAQLWQNIIPALPDYIPIEPDYTPVNPSRSFNNPTLRPAQLSRRIYLDMRRAIQTYSQLIVIAPQGDRNTIQSLRSQMEIISVSMFYIYQNLSGATFPPRVFNHNPPLPRNYPLALQITYDRVYNIYLQTLTLLTLTQGSSNQTTLLIILNNLRSQLRTLQSLMT